MVGMWHRRHRKGHGVPIGAAACGASASPPLLWRTAPPVLSPAPTPPGVAPGGGVIPVFHALHNYAFTG